MLKGAINFLVGTFILVLCYDTIKICLNQINLKKESELLIVKREIKETNQQVENSTPYETYDFPVWTVALGFLCAFCSVVCHFILSSKFISLKRVAGKGSVYDNFNKIQRNNVRENGEFSYDADIDQKYDLTKCSDVIESEVVHDKKSIGLFSGHDLVPKNNSKTDSSAPLGKAGQENSFMNVCLPKLFPDDMFPAQSSINVISNIGLTAPRSFYGEEKSRTKHISKTFYEKSCEILAVNNAIFDESASLKSEDSNDSLSIKHGQIMELFTVFNSDISKSHQTITSDKSISAQLLTYTDNDIRNIEKRLENIEYGLRRSEEKTKEWGNRINVAETELVDLHEQMYTIFSKFEEEKKTNYIIVSKVSKDKIIPKDKDVFDTIAEELHEYEQVNEKADDVSRNKRLKEMPNPESVTSVKDSSEEESVDEDDSANENKSSDEEIHIGGRNSIEESAEVILSELKQKSIALEALLESKSRSQINAYLPKKKIPQLNVPPHILPPYRRSSFAGTDSRIDPRKRRLNMKKPNCGSEFFWGTRV